MSIFKVEPADIKREKKGNKDNKKTGHVAEFRLYTR